MKITLSKVNRNIAIAAATDDTRPLLQHLCVREGWVVAADGFVMARMRHSYRGKQVLIPATFLKHFKRSDDVVFTVTPTRITGDAGSFSVSVPRPTSLGTFPDHHQVVAATVTHDARPRVAFSPYLMRRALEMPVAIDKYAAVRMHLYGESNAMILKADVYDMKLDRHTDLEVIVMPMFVKW